LAHTIKVIAGGLAKVGYSVAEEVPFFLVVFAVPTAVALLVLWRATRG